MGQAQGQSSHVTLNAMASAHMAALNANPQKDYIPNLGDCIDLVILGLGWDIDRARDLRGKFPCRIMSDQE